MKKLFTLFLALVMIVSMAACGKTETPDNSGDNAGKATYRWACASWPSTRLWTPPPRASWMR